MLSAQSSDVNDIHTCSHPLISQRPPSARPRAAHSPRGATSAHTGRTGLHQRLPRQPWRLALPPAHRARGPHVGGTRPGLASPALCGAAGPQAGDELQGYELQPDCRAWGLWLMLHTWAASPQPSGRSPRAWAAPGQHLVRKHELARLVCARLLGTNVAATPQASALSAIGRLTCSWASAGDRSFRCSQELVAKGPSSWGGRECRLGPEPLALPGEKAFPCPPPQPPGQRRRLQGLTCEEAMTRSTLQEGAPASSALRLSLP